MPSSLHEAIKNYYAQPGDLIEAAVDGYLIDIVHGQELIEIQTRNFNAIKAKLNRLVECYSIQLVYPIPLVKWIIRDTLDKQPISRRKSPKRGRPEQVFAELVRIPQLINQDNFTLVILLTVEEEIRINDGRGSWRRSGWSIADRRLISIVEKQIYQKPTDFLHLLPSNLVQPFTVHDLAASTGLTKSLSYKMTYCLRKMGLLELVGKQKRSNLYHIMADRPL